MNKKGFTLIEMIFAMALLCIVSVVILRMYVVASTIENDVDTLEMAALEASNAIEDYKAGQINVKTYYDEKWQEVTDKKSASFERYLYIEDDTTDKRLHFLEVQLWDMENSDQLFSIKTRYFSTKE